MIGLVLFVGDQPEARCRCSSNSLAVTSVERCVLSPPQYNCRPFNLKYCSNMVASFLQTPEIISAPTDLIPFHKKEDSTIQLVEVQRVEDVHKPYIRFYIVDGQHTVDAAKNILALLWK
ncbi:hypothetical protein O6H91_22G008800 [Diphasiastrum complanatum]|uniref:Uncharacterized protein n=1 Tax=Diphasiastrum complanatum TaxID=34168 RepID=A0ACC2ACK0_DIPCM|nr:hypothetical protein O6H91_22G008800 [Diphasiastrum complanatum]